MTDSEKDFPIAKFRKTMKDLAEQYDSKISNKKNGSSDKQPEYPTDAAGRTKSIVELTDSEYEMFINRQFAVD